MRTTYCKARTSRTDFRTPLVLRRKRRGGEGNTVPGTMAGYSGCAQAKLGGDAARELGCIAARVTLYLFTISNVFVSCNLNTLVCICVSS